MSDRVRMRDRIKMTALDLLIQNGYRGVSFGDLASALDTTRANIHYHFGNKQTLVEEVLVDYVEETKKAMSEIWDDPEIPLVAKIEANVEFSRKRYLRYNKPGKEGRPWSLIARMRQDSAVLTSKGHDALQDFAAHLLRCVTDAVRSAVERNGEFVPTIPVEDVALQLFNISNSASPITQDSRDFDRLAQLNLGFARIITNAFGRNVRSAITTERPATRKGAVSRKR